MDKRKDGRKNGQTLFYRTLLAKAGDPKRGSNLDNITIASHGVNITSIFVANTR